MEFVYDSIGPKPAARAKMEELIEAVEGEDYQFYISKIGTNHVIMATSKTIKLPYDEAQTHIRSKLVAMRKAKREAEKAEAEAKAAAEE